MEGEDMMRVLREEDIMRDNKTILILKIYHLYYKVECRGPGGRAEDSRSRGPEFESRHWANFQRLWQIFEIEIHMSHRQPNVNGELRGRCDLTVSL